VLHLQVFERERGLPDVGELGVWRSSCCRADVHEIILIACNEPANASRLRSNVASAVQPASSRLPSTNLACTHASTGALSAPRDWKFLNMITT